MFTTFSGYIGSCAANIMADDLVYVLHGCPLPVILPKSLSRADAFELVGECFVTGLTNGDAIDLVEAGQLDEQTMTLV